MEFKEFDCLNKVVRNDDLILGDVKVPLWDFFSSRCKEKFSDV